MRIFEREHQLLQKQRATEVFEQQRDYLSTIYKTSHSHNDIKIING